MTIEKFEQAKTIRDRIEDLKQNISDLHSYKIWQIILNDGTELREIERGKIKDILIKDYQDKIDNLEERFKEI